MNRQQRRSAQRGGQDAGAGAGTPDPAVSGTFEPGTFEPGTDAGDVSGRRTRTVEAGLARRRTTPRQFLHEVNVEMRKVAWPTRGETINYASVVLVTLVLVMALIFGLDTGFSQASLYLFK